MGNWKRCWLEIQKEDTVGCEIWENCRVDAALNKLIKNYKPIVINPPNNFIKNNINRMLQKTIIL